MFEPVTAIGERGRIDIVCFPSGALAVYMQVGSLSLHVVGYIPLDTLEKWWGWLGINQPEHWQKA